MIRLKEKEFIYIKMEHHIQVNGLMISNMAMELKNGQMVHNMMDISLKDSRKVMEHLFGMMETNMRGSSNQIVLKVSDIMLGLMEDNMKVLGEITKCMEEVSSHGLMEEGTKDNM